MGITLKGKNLLPDSSPLFYVTIYKRVELSSLKIILLTHMRNVRNDRNSYADYDNEQEVIRKSIW